MMARHTRLDEYDHYRPESPDSPAEKPGFVRNHRRIVALGTLFIVVVGTAIAIKANGSSSRSTVEDTVGGLQVKAAIAPEERVSSERNPSSKSHQALPSADEDGVNLRGSNDEASISKVGHAHTQTGKKSVKRGATSSFKKDDWTPWISLPNPKLFKEARARAVTGQELTYPVELRSPVTLTLQETTLPTPWLGGYFTTRGYGSIPGPTIRVKPGEMLEINLQNALGEGPGYESCNFDQTDLGFFMNPATICALNHTNLHTHGLHVSPEGEGDSIFHHLKPGENKTIRIKIPENHMGGTHWYHPHLHHATAAQAGGGAHGALLVDDPTYSIPAYLEDMPEKLMFLSLANVAKMLRFEAWGLGTLQNWSVAEQRMWKNPVYPHWSWAPFSGILAEHGDAMNLDSIGVDPALVVNGQWKPKVTLEEGKWYRLRFAFASIEQRVEIFPAGHKFGAAYCQYQLLAKDGIYLHEAPRPIHRIYLVSGSRADVAVSCTCGFLQSSCKTQLNYEAKWQPMGLGPIGITMASSKGKLLTLETGHQGSPVPFKTVESPELQTFSVRRPCYLADLRQAEVPVANHHQVDMPQLYPMKVTFDGKGTVWGHETPEPMANLKLGEVQEWVVTGIRFHPFHTHVNPYQVVQVWNDPYYLPGDWHDTMLPVGAGSATVRMNMDRFTGKMITHCHILEHEDNGMMGFVQISGQEGATWLNAHSLDPQCYDGHFPGPPAAELPPRWR